MKYGFKVKIVTDTQKYDINLPIQIKKGILGSELIFKLIMVDIQWDFYLLHHDDVGMLSFVKASFSVQHTLSSQICTFTAH